MKIELCDGKYTYINDEKGQRALRYGEPWRDLIGDGFVLAMAQRIDELEETIKNMQPNEQENTEFPNGWYFVKMKQVLKADRKDPDYIEDWVERINGEWDLGGYKLNCDFDSVIRREEIEI